MALHELARMSIVQFVLLKPWRWRSMEMLEAVDGSPRVEIRRHIRTGIVDAWFFLNMAEHGNIVAYRFGDLPKLVAEWRRFMAKVDANLPLLEEDKSYWPFHAELAKSALIPDGLNRSIGPLEFRRRTVTGAVHFEISGYGWKPRPADLKDWLDRLDDFQARYVPSSGRE